VNQHHADAGSANGIIPKRHGKDGQYEVTVPQASSHFMGVTSHKYEAINPPKPVSRVSPQFVNSDKITNVVNCRIASRVFFMLLAALCLEDYAAT
jgi:hypothetical protein